MTPDPAPWECPRCHCLFERPRFGHEPCGDPVSVTLAEAKRIADTLAFACRIPDKVPDFTACGGPAAEAYWAYFTPARITSLLAAIEAVLELHQPGRIKVFGYTCKSHEQHRFFSITSTEAGDVRACGQCTATVYNACTGCGPQVSVDACPVREAVTTALTGDSETGDHRTEAERRAADEALEALRERLAGDGN